MDKFHIRVYKCVGATNMFIVFAKKYGDEYTKLRYVLYGSTLDHHRIYDKSWTVLNKDMIPMLRNHFHKNPHLKYINEYTLYTNGKV